MFSLILLRADCNFNRIRPYKLFEAAQKNYSNTQKHALLRQRIHLSVASLARFPGCHKAVNLLHRPVRDIEPDPVAGTPQVRVLAQKCKVVQVVCESCGRRDVCCLEFAWNLGNRYHIWRILKRHDLFTKAQNSLNCTWQMCDVIAVVTFYTTPLLCMLDG